MGFINLFVIIHQSMKLGPYLLHNSSADFSLPAFPHIAKDLMPLSTRPECWSVPSSKLEGNQPYLQLLFINVQLPVCAMHDKNAKLILPSTMDSHMCNPFHTMPCILSQRPVVPNFHSIPHMLRQSPAGQTYTYSTTVS